MKKRQLRAQLGAEATNIVERDALARLAQDIGKADVPHLSRTSKYAIAEQLGIHRTPKWRSPMTLALSGSFAALVILVIVAQSAQPGSMLYALKRGSERARATIDPGFKDDIAERRKQEAAQLKSNTSASDEQIQKAEDAVRHAESEAHDDSSGRSSSGDDSLHSEDEQREKVDNSGPGSSNSGRDEQKVDDKSGGSSGSGSDHDDPIDSSGHGSDD